MVRFTLSFAGAGNVAGSLCHKLKSSGHKIEKIVSETEPRGKLLAKECSAKWSDDLFFPEKTDLLIVAVPDHMLNNVLLKIQCHPETLVVHTAGSYGLEVFPSTIIRKGVFYPLQTFSPGREINYTNLPFLLEADSDSSLELLKTLAETIGGRSYIIDIEQRKKIHLAAVFVCNFVNHMLTSGKKLVAGTQLPFTAFEPLLSETIKKALICGPEKSQTGPAIRNDRNTIKKHLDLLSFSPDLIDIYNYITKSIQEYYKIQTNE